MDNIFRHKKANFEKLINYGFERQCENLVYVTVFDDIDFEMTITVNAHGDLSTKMMDRSLCEEYSLHLVEGATGGFVGDVRTHYEQALTDIADKCFDPQVFKCEQTIQLIDYVKKTYNRDLEFLWEKFDDNAIWRRADTQKLFGVVCPVSKQKLGIDSDEKVEIFVFRVPTADIENVVDNKQVYLGYHMNKKHWCTIILDGSVPFERITQFLQVSYDLAVK